MFDGMYGKLKGVREVLSSDISIDKVQLDKIRQGALEFVDTDDKPTKEWLITAQEGGANKYHYYMLMADGTGWKGNGRIGAAPVMNPITDKPAARNMEQQIEFIISRKTQYQYKLQDIAAIDKGEAVAKHAGNDPRRAEPELTAAIKAAGVVQDVEASPDWSSLSYSFMYKGQPGSIYAHNDGRVDLSFGKGRRDWDRIIRREKDLKTWPAALDYIKMFLTKPEMLDKLVVAMD